MSKHMIIFGVTWDVEKCLYARDPLAGLGVGTLERGQNIGPVSTKVVSLEIVSNFCMSSNLHQPYQRQTFFMVGRACLTSRISLNCVGWPYQTPKLDPALFSYSLHIGGTNCSWIFMVDSILENIN